MQGTRLVLAICLFLQSSMHLLAQDMDHFEQRPGVIGVEVRFPSKTVIEEHQEKIVSALKQNSYLQNGIRVGIGIGALAVAWALYYDYTIHISGPQDKLALSESQKLALAIIFLQKKFSDFTLSANQPEQNVGWVSSITGGAFALTKGLAILATQAFTLQFLNRGMTHIFHEHSVEWFSREKTSLPEIYDELNAMKEFVRVDSLKNKSFYITQYQADQYVSSLIRLYNALVIELEPIIGYVHYKSEVMNVHQNHLYGDAVLGTYLFKRAYDVAQELHDIKSAYPDFTDNDQRVTAIIKMFDYIELFSLEINSALGSFKRFEKEMYAI